MISQFMDYCYSQNHGKDPEETFDADVFSEQKIQCPDENKFW